MLLFPIIRAVLAVRLLRATLRFLHHILLVDIAVLLEIPKFFPNVLQLLLIHHFL